MSGKSRQVKSTLISEFVVQNDDYYAEKFQKIEESNRLIATFNWASALFGPVWFAARGFWGWFLIFMALKRSAESFENAAQQAQLGALTAYRFTVNSPPDWLIGFPSSKYLYINLSNGLDQIFKWLTVNGDGFFDAIRYVINYSCFSLFGSFGFLGAKHGNSGFAWGR